MQNLHYVKASTKYFLLLLKYLTFPITMSHVLVGFLDQRLSKWRKDGGVILSISKKNRLKSSSTHNMNMKKTWQQALGPV